jgi:hypothetical protein
MNASEKRQSEYLADLAIFLCTEVPSIPIVTAVATVNALFVGNKLALRPAHFQPPVLAQ